tara:strand:- start:4819 stop:5625 length:807 start_codon:yes stop_codon:yes gene_type:complete
MLQCGITGHKGNLGKTFLKENKKFHFIKFKGDISKKKDINLWIKNNHFDLMVHFAAIVPTNVVNKNYQKAIKVNFKGTKYLIDEIIRQKKNIKWFFFSSSSHVYKMKRNKINEKSPKIPSSKYGKTKLLAENYIIKKLKKSNIKYCIGRIFSIYDNKEKNFLIPNLLKKINQKEKKIIFDNLNHYRDFLTTSQISQIIFFLWKKRYQGIINIGSGIKINIELIAQKFATKLNKKISFNKNRPTFLIADNSKLKKIGYNKKNLKLKSFF